MAKRRKRRSNSTRVQRDNSISLGSLLDPLRPLRPVHVETWPERMTEIEDRRTFHPLKSFRPPAVLLGASGARVVPAVGPARQAKRGRPVTRDGVRGVPTHLAFDAPRSVLVCVRRSRRREVLHALKRTGRGARARHRKRNPFSEIRC